MRQLLVVIGALGLFASSMAAADYYEWETDSKTQAYTDSPERIPARYRDSARQVEEASIHDYGRATRVDTPPVAAAPASQLVVLDAAADSEPSAVQAGPRLSFEREGITFSVADGDQPILVEEGVLLHDENGHLVEHTIIRQGDTVLMKVVKPLVRQVD